MARRYFSLQSTIPYYTGLPTDVVTNVWHFYWPNVSEPLTSDYNILRDKVSGFYEYIFGVGGVQMAQWARPANHTVKIYDLEDAKPRVPVYSVTDALVGILQDTAGTIVPEAAVCVSFSGVVESGDKAARKRGRFFLGALGNSCMGVGGASAFPIVNSSLQTRANAAAQTIATGTGSTDWVWCVYSPTTYAATSSYDQAFSKVVKGFTDNAFDTQRRRQNLATNRTSWAL